MTPSIIRRMAATQYPGQARTRIEVPAENLAIGRSPARHTGDMMNGVGAVSIAFDNHLIEIVGTKEELDNVLRAFSQLIGKVRSG